MNQSTSLLFQVPNTMYAAVRGLGAVVALFVVGCNGQQTRDLDAQSLAMISCPPADPNKPAPPPKGCTAPFYDDGELQIYEVQYPVNLPIVKPTPDESSKLGGKIGPFSHHPWVTADEGQGQVTWTLANLDKAEHTVAVVVDPWNEFGRYVPAIAKEGDNAVPDLSGIEETYDLPALGGDRSSRIQHTFSFDDMNELAVDFATVINILTTVKPPAPMDGVQMDDPRVGLVNHAFNVKNRHGSDPYTDSYIPTVIPGLLGFNLGLKTLEPANIAIEFLIELVDQNGDKVVVAGSSDPTLKAPNHVYSLPAG
jgi:hypothetical protein